ncbi:hypothetical protein NSQ26_13155 [Bacillus sp. FSL W7-1360]
MKEKLSRLHTWYTSGEGYVHCGPESVRHLYIILLRFGMFVFGFSIANIFYVYLNDSLRLLGLLILLGYFIGGALIIHMGWPSLTRMTVYVVKFIYSFMDSVGSVFVCATRSFGSFFHPNDLSRYHRGSIVMSIYGGLKT